ncbi:hypothetical protein PHLCEN_2v2411 [Hermanssonia centrifuga]|uniref:Uncharacterized protein n=1 Tax=Hermanssonia centrifuga TaxID=98765 RepID=A0A2R6RM51_9APHY|nr:hypothetical protein PHLCEN_2v2411 [Hermanssonia centrifuga]
MANYCLPEKSIRYFKKGSLKLRHTGTMGLTSGYSQKWLSQRQSAHLLHGIARDRRLDWLIEELWTDAKHNVIQPDCSSEHIETPYSHPKRHLWDEERLDA